MYRKFFLATVAAVCVPFTAMAADVGRVEVTAPSNLSPDVPVMTKALVDAAFRLPATASPDDFLQLFVAEIAASGYTQVTVFSAIDAAIGTPGLSRPALAALESLRKRVHNTRDYTAALGNSHTESFSPGLSTGGGSDYLR